jgi:hypothetical protein
MQCTCMYMREDTSIEDAVERIIVEAELHLRLRLF